jgi:hypothetical protein
MSEMVRFRRAYPSLSDLPEEAVQTLTVYAFWRWREAWLRLFWWKPGVLLWRRWIG